MYLKLILIFILSGFPFESRAKFASEIGGSDDIENKCLFYFVIENVKVSDHYKSQYLEELISIENTNPNLSSPESKSNSLPFQNKSMNIINALAPYLSDPILNYKALEKEFNSIGHESIELFNKLNKSLSTETTDAEKEKLNSAITLIKKLMNYNNSFFRKLIRSASSPNLEDMIEIQNYFYWQETYLKVKNEDTLEALQKKLILLNNSLNGINTALETLTTLWKRFASMSTSTDILNEDFTFNPSLENIKIIIKLIETRISQISSIKLLINFAQQNLKMEFQVALEFKQQMALIEQNMQTLELTQNKIYQKAKRISDSRRISNHYDEAKDIYKKILLELENHQKEQEKILKEKKAQEFYESNLKNVSQEMKLFVEFIHKSDTTKEIFFQEFNHQFSNITEADFAYLIMNFPKLMSLKAESLKTDYYFVRINHLIEDNISHYSFYKQFSVLIESFLKTSGSSTPHIFTEWKSSVQSSKPNVQSTIDLYFILIAKRNSFSKTSEDLNFINWATEKYLLDFNSSNSRYLLGALQYSIHNPTTRKENQSSELALYEHILNKYDIDEISEVPFQYLSELYTYLIDENSYLNFNELIFILRKIQTFSESDFNNLYSFNISKIADKFIAHPDERKEFEKFKNYASKKLQFILFVFSKLSFTITETQKSDAKMLISYFYLKNTHPEYDSLLKSYWQIKAHAFLISPKKISNSSKDKIIEKTKSKLMKFNYLNLSSNFFDLNSVNPNLKFYDGKPESSKLLLSLIQKKYIRLSHQDLLFVINKYLKLNLSQSYSFQNYTTFRKLASFLKISNINLDIDSNLADLKIPDELCFIIILILNSDFSNETLKLISNLKFVFDDFFNIYPSTELPYFEITIESILNIISNKFLTFNITEASQDQKFEKLKELYLSNKLKISDNLKSYISVSIPSKENYLFAKDQNTFDYYLSGINVIRTKDALFLAIDILNNKDETDKQNSKLFLDLILKQLNIESDISQIPTHIHQLALILNAWSAEDFKLSIENWPINTSIQDIFRFLIKLSLQNIDASETTLNGTNIYKLYLTFLSSFLKEDIKEFKKPDGFLNSIFYNHIPKNGTNSTGPK